MSLSPGAYRLLRGIDDKLRHAGSVDRPRSGKAVSEIEAWCAEYDIDLATHRLGKTLRFDRRLLLAMERVLDSLGQPPLSAELSGRTTAEQARQGSLEAKSVRQSPRARRVLVSLPAASRLPFLTTEPRDYRDLDWEALELSAFDALIQVENLDSFYAFTPDIEAISHFRQPLVVYRGDHHYGGGFATLAEAWAATNKVHLYAGDFDAKGINIAIDSQATHVLLPPLQWLVQRASPDHLPATQMRYQPRLSAHRATLPYGHPLRDYLALMLDRQRGLKQQWFGEQMEMIALGLP